MPETQLDLLTTTLANAVHAHDLALEAVGKARERDMSTANRANLIRQRSKAAAIAAESAESAAMDAAEDTKAFTTLAAKSAVASNESRLLIAALKSFERGPMRATERALLVAELEAAKRYVDVSDARIAQFQGQLSAALASVAEANGTLRFESFESERGTELNQEAMRAIRARDTAKIALSNFDKDDKS